MQLLCRDLRPLIQKLRREIRPIGPHQRVQVGIYPELTKVLRLSEWFENLAVKLRAQVHLALDPILKPYEDNVIPNDLIMMGPRRPGSAAWRGNRSRVG